MGEFNFGIRFLFHAQQQISQFTMQFCISGVKRDGIAKLIHVRVAHGQQLTGLIGCIRFTAAGCSQQCGGRLFRMVAQALHTPYCNQNRFALRLQVPGRQIMLCRKVPIVALLRQLGQFVMDTKRR